MMREPRSLVGMETIQVISPLQCKAVMCYKGYLNIYHVTLPSSTVLYYVYTSCIIAVAVSTVMPSSLLDWNNCGWKL